MSDEKEMSYVLYYDYGEIELDESGDIVNEEKLYIAEYDEDGNFIRRVDFEFSRDVFEIPMDITVEEMERMAFIGDGSSTPKEAFNALNKYLDNYRQWKQISPATWYEPAEYICIGLEGRCEEPLYRPHRKISKTVLNAIMKQKVEI